uniref:phospholipase effector Tle1 domain-containing protein n=1 Tax=Streptomyces sp. Tue6028 TaxID=2036037 RepID=UPI003D70A3CF
YLGIPTIAAPRSLSSAIAVQVNRQSAFHDNVLSSRVKGAFQALAIDERRAQYPPALWLLQPGAAENGQELKQVWFTGTHGDIGGGYAETALSDITLLWMIAQATRYGLEFDTEALDGSRPRKTTSGTRVDFTIRPDPMGPVHDSRTGVSKTTRPLDRRIGEPIRDHFETYEYVSETAKQRRDSDPAYRPPGLEMYLAAN